MSSVYGQKTVLEMEMKGGKAQNVFSANDSNGNLVYIFQGTKSFQISIFDPSYKSINEFLVDKDVVEKKDVVIGTAFTNKKIVLYLYNEKAGVFSSLAIDRVTGESKYSPEIGTLRKDEFLLKTFEMNGVFYVMAIPEFKNAVVLFSSDEGGQLVIRNYEINYQGFYAKLASNNNDINQKTSSPVGIERISYDIENNVKSAYPTKKLYTFGNKIYMTFEEPAHTHLIIIDPAATNSSYRKLNFSLDEAKDKTPKQGNSFLFKGDLFRVTFNNDQLNLIVINLDSMELIKSYNVFPDQPISFINGVIIEDGNDIKDRVVKTTSLFFRKINRGAIAIAVNEPKNGEYATELGVYDEYTTARGGSGFPVSPGLSIGGGVGIGIGVGVGIGMGSGGFGSMGGYPSYPSSGYTTTSVHVAYFNSMFRVDNLAHIEGVVPKSVREKINDYEMDVLKNNNDALLNYVTNYNNDYFFNKNNPELYNILSNSNRLILGYYVKGRSKYILAEFRK